MRATAARDVLLHHSPGNRGTADLRVLIEWALSVQVFKDVEFLSLGAIFQDCDIFELRAGEPLFYQGSQGDGYWVVLEGELELFIMDDESLARQTFMHYHRMDVNLLVKSHELLEGKLGNKIKTLTSGEALGELSLLSNELRSCAAVSYGSTPSK